MKNTVTLAKLYQLDYRHHYMTVCHKPPLRHVWRITQLQFELLFCAESPHDISYQLFQLTDFRWYASQPVTFHDRYLLFDLNVDFTH